MEEDMESWILRRHIETSSIMDTTLDDENEDTIKELNIWT
jgi:hypothetical protein